MLVYFLNGMGIKMKVHGWMEDRREIVRCLFLWCYDKKTQSCRALNLILIHFWLVIILTWLIIKAEPSKQEFRFNLLELQNIFLIIHWVLKTDWFINVTWNKKPTRVWDERSFQSPIWIQSNFPNHSPAAVGRTRLDGRYQKIQCEPRNLFAPREIVVLDVSDGESNIFNGTILYIL